MTLLEELQAEHKAECVRVIDKICVDWDEVFWRESVLFNFVASGAMINELAAVEDYMHPENWRVM